MKLEKTLKLSALYDAYGKMLTKKQQQIFECYYFDDISLAEIATIIKITKQAVKDSLDKSEKILLEYESKLGFQKKFELLEKEFSNDEKAMEKIKNVMRGD